MKIHEAKPKMPIAERIRRHRERIRQAIEVPLDIVDLQQILQPFQNPQGALEQARSNVNSSTVPHKDDAQLLSHLGNLTIAIENSAAAEQPRLDAARQRIELAINNRRLARELQQLKKGEEIQPQQQGLVVH